MGSRDWQRIAYEAEKSRDNAIAQLEYEQANRRKSDMEIAHERDDFIKELETASTVMRAALVAIQELHKPVWTAEPFPGGYLCGVCDIMLRQDPCPTWMLADDALGGDQDG